MKTHPFSLDLIQIASPCHAAWDEMTGDNRTRFCGQCSKHVYNLSDMSRDEAETFLREQTDSVCVRFYRRADGTVLTADCPVGLWDVRTRLARLWAGTLAILGFLSFGAWSFGSRSADWDEKLERLTTVEGPAAAFRDSLAEPMLMMGACPIPVKPGGVRSAVVPLVEETLGEKPL